MPCTLPDPNDCVSKETLNWMDIVVFTEEVAFDPSNKDKPISYLTNSDDVLELDI